MFVAFLFGVTLVLAQLTSIRGEASFGVLDIALVGTAVLAAGWSLANAVPVSGRSVAVSGQGQQGLLAALASPLSLYALISALLITISYVLNAQRPAASAESLGSASVAFYAISVLLLCMIIVLYSRYGRAMLAGFISGSFVLGLVYVAGFVTQNPAMLYFDVRFTGLAQNPNQTALLALGTLNVLVISLLRFEQNDRIMRWMILATIPLTLVYGLATLSDALLVALPVWGLFTGLLLLERMQVKRWVAIVIGIVFVAVFTLVLAILMPGLFGLIGSGIQDQLATGSQDTDRQLLWRHGLQAFSESVWVGNGPGAWSGFGGPYQGQEAHNSFIDWLSITGVLGLFPVLIVLAGLARTDPRFRLVRAAGFFTLVVFATFHFTFRLPIFWFSMAMLITPFFSWADGPANSDRMTPRSAPRP